ncbi:hypothetical protein GCM10022395_23300 [Snuella lapsa]|uniref:Uncharacterized protein n=2 Tax=Snuella lapsa TaxID=870481 RepID=A0ABP6XVS5_9FLAO
MFDFGTSSGQAVYPSRTNIGTSSGQALVPIVKHIQTRENNKNNIKPQNFENLDLNVLETEDKQMAAVPFEDNLKTSSDKNYSEPL